MSQLLRPAILAIEPDRATVCVIQRELGLAGYDLCFVPGAAAARRRLRDKAPDLLIVAERLADCDGMALVASLVAECEMPCVPVLFLAGDPGFAPRARALGAACLLKPLAAPRLVEAVGRLSVRTASRPPAPSRRLSPALVNFG